MSITTIIYNLLIGTLQLIFEIIYAISYRIIQNEGLSIIVLSVLMNILVLPLYKRADAMQEESRNIEEKLKIGVAHIKKTFSGDEQMMILQTYYRQNSYKPTDVLNGSISLLLEIPFFIAAYQFLSHLTVLKGISFGPISDLGAPDALLTICGITINILPILMTLINIVSGAIYAKGSSVKIKVQLYGTALIFLIFLYESPSGLVFYWTLNNIFSLGKNIVYKIIANLKKKKYISNSEEEKALKSIYRLIGEGDKKVFLLSSLVITLLVGVLIPSAVIASSTQEFIDVTYYYDPTWYVVSSAILAIGLFLIWMRVFYWIAGPVGKTIFDNLIWMVSGVMLVNYLFFDKELGVLSSTLVYSDFSFTRQERIINLLVCFLIFIGMYFMMRKSKRFVKGILSVVMITLICMSIINMFEIRKGVAETKRIIETGTVQEESSPYFTLSKDGKNVVVLMLDRAVGGYVPYIFNQYPELKEEFSGFTYYSNVISHGTCTIIGSPGVYGGYEYIPSEMNAREDEDLAEKHNEALKLMPFIFAENDYEVTVCDPPLTNHEWITDLSIYDEYPEINTYIVDGKFDDESLKQLKIENNKRNFFCFSIMKTLPYRFQYYVYEGGRYNQLVVTEETTEYKYLNQTIYSQTLAKGVNQEFMTSYNALKNMEKMTQVSEGDTNHFLLMANDLPHAPMLLALPDYMPMQEVDNTAYLNSMYPDSIDGIELKMENAMQLSNYHASVATYMLLGEWFEYLKEQGVYDNTRIILVSDHGTTTGQIEELKLNFSELQDITAVYPLLMVKDFDSEGFVISDEFMTNADTPTLAFENLIENPINPFTGKEVSNSKKEEEQYINISSLFNVDDHCENTFAASQWCVVKDNIWEKENWRFIEEYLLVPTEYKVK